MKTTTLLTLILLTATVALGQGVAINETGAAPDPSAMLDVTSTEKGVLIPRMTQTQRNTISQPAQGLLIYQTDATPGFYVNAGTPVTPIWQAVSGNVEELWQKSGQHIYRTEGNVGIGIPNPSGKLHVGMMGEWAGVTFSGTGLDDIKVNITGYNNTGSTSYAVRIQNAGPNPNLIEISNTCGSTWSAPMPISPNIQMGYGVFINFPNTYGYTYGDRWDWTVNESFENVLVVKDGNLGIGQVDPSAQLHTTGSVRFDDLSGTSSRIVVASDNGTLTTQGYIFQVGDFAHGGVVFWVDESGQHGLVSATTDGIESYWQQGVFRTYATGDGVFSGYMNTSQILAIQAAVLHGVGTLTDDIPALFCANFTEGGYGDWYLPSKAELNLMYQNKSIINAVSIANGGTVFFLWGHWSSTEYDSSEAWYQNFFDGNQAIVAKTGSLNSCRCIRAF